MRFGIFDHMDRSGEPLSAQYESRLKILEACDAAGFYSYHLAEHHGTPLGLAPSPSVFLSSVAQRTKRLRLGALVFTLSLYHPLRLIDEICMLDHLSKGRLDVGLGRGISPIELGFYGVDPAQAPDIYAEVSAIILQGLQTNSLTYEGRHFSFRDVPIELSPVQKPIPLWYGVGNVESAQRAAQNGINIICNGPPQGVRKLTDAYRVARPDDGASAPFIGMSRHMVIAETDSEARDLAREGCAQWLSNLLLLWRKHNVKPTLAFPATFDEADAMGVCLVGTASTVRDKLRKQADEAGINYILCRLAFGNLPMDASLRTVRLVRDEIMPAFAPSLPVV
ncbi:MAG: LLM class flavin-dependent oxidoreductase [Rhizobiaceae bacterium]|nr:MAG: LLM class flavin-dependent oxidoreductase [Rhizobiaceae bacterium]